ncbi:hypothetical protein BB560_000777 [Smittium megazygosporum]|uniref:Tr-type G domain-containing protein n=1 Tax=Smittium megazygosporum TaxID=133381 RepID=A0A2T9ZJC8_9FUNG|nr:hypothetical protein BB560_000777 [Smittium megazygosporum]
MKKEVSTYLDSLLKRRSILCISENDARRGKLLPEADLFGNIEYKFKLVDVTESRISHLSTQLNWRLTEGNGQAIYQIGVLDDGTICGISSAEMFSTLSVIRRMAEQLKNVKITEIHIRKLRTGPIVSLSPCKIDEIQPDSSNPFKYLAQIHLTQEIDLNSISEIRLAMLGEHKSGKSTLLGCLAHNIQDDSKGRARLTVLQHRHELNSGTSSSISMHRIKLSTRYGLSSGSENANDSDLLTSKLSDSALDSQKFDPDSVKSKKPQIEDDFGSVFSFSKENPSFNELSIGSKYITFVDTCGHQKFHKVTTRGLFSRTLDYLMLFISAENKYIPASTYQYLIYSALFGKPLLIAITKMDVVKISSFNKLIRAIVSLLKMAFPKTGQSVVNTLDTSNNISYESLCSMANDFMEQSLIVIFLCSSTSSPGSLAVLKDFLFLLKPKFMTISLKYRSMLTHSIPSQKIVKKEGYEIPSSLSKKVQTICEVLMEQSYFLDDTGWIITGRVMSGTVDTSKELDLESLDNKLVSRNHQKMLEEKAPFGFTTDDRSAHSIMEVEGFLERNKGHLNVFMNRIGKEQPQKRVFFVGPDKDGNFMQIKILSIHLHRVPVSVAYEGQIVSILISSCGSSSISKLSLNYESISNQFGVDSNSLDFIEHKRDTEQFESKMSLFSRPGSYLVGIDYSEFANGYSYTPFRHALIDNSQKTDTSSESLHSAFDKHFSCISSKILSSRDSKGFYRSKSCASISSLDVNSIPGNCSNISFSRSCPLDRTFSLGNILEKHLNEQSKNAYNETTGNLGVVGGQHISGNVGIVSDVVFANVIVLSQTVPFSRYIYSVDQNSKIFYVSKTKQDIQGCIPLLGTTRTLYSDSIRCLAVLDMVEFNGQLYVLDGHDSNKSGSTGGMRRHSHFGSSKALEFEPHESSKSNRNKRFSYNSGPSGNLRNGKTLKGLLRRSSNDSPGTLANSFKLCDYMSSEEFWGKMNKFTDIEDRIELDYRQGDLTVKYNYLSEKGHQNEKYRTNVRKKKAYNSSTDTTSSKPDKCANSTETIKEQILYADSEGNSGSKKTDKSRDNHSELLVNENKFADYNSSILDVNQVLKSQGKVQQPKPQIEISMGDILLVRFKLIGGYKYIRNGAPLVLKQENEDILAGYVSFRKW